MSTDDLAQLVKNARKISGLTQKDFARQLKRGQSLVSKYERGLVVPPGDVIMHCMNLVGPSTSDTVISTADVTRLIERKLAAPEFWKLRSAIALLVESVPDDPAGYKGKARRHS